MLSSTYGLVGFSLSHIILDNNIFLACVLLNFLTFRLTGQLSQEQPVLFYDEINYRPNRVCPQISPALPQADVCRASSLAALKFLVVIFLCLKSEPVAFEAHTYFECMNDQ
jgi:hypothetical protein